jgi:hypothetical protein
VNGSQSDLTTRLGSHATRTVIIGIMLLSSLAGCGAGGDRPGSTTSYSHTAVYSVLTTDTNVQQLRVSYTDGTGQSKDADTSLSTWSQSVQFDRPVPTVVLTGSAAGGLGGVECIIEFDGKTVSQHTGRGVATCSYNVPAS